MSKHPLTQLSTALGLAILLKGLWTDMWVPT